MRTSSMLARVLCFVAATAVALDGHAGSPPLGGQSGGASPVHRQLPPPLKPQPASFTVTIDQAAGQLDPAAGEPVQFTVVFAIAIDPLTFTPSDILQNGTATVTTWTILDSGDHRHFTLSALGLTAGTVVPSLPAGVVQDAAAQSNTASFGTDSSVTFGPLACATGTYLYAGVWSPPEIHVFCIAADGTLTAQGVVNAPGDVRDLEVSADAHSLFYAHTHLAKYTISTDGSLTLAGSAAVGNGTFFDLTLDPSDPSGQMLYGTHSKNGGNVFVYDTLAPSAAPALAQIVQGLYLPRGLAIRPAGNSIHVANGGIPQEIHTYPLNVNGTLNTGGMVVTDFEPRPHMFAIPPGLPLLYWTESPGGSVLTGAVGAGGSVTLADSIPAGYGAGSLTLDAAGTHLYVANYIADDITVFGIDGSGNLDFEQLADTARRPEHLVLHPDGSHLYVASAGDVNGSSTITVYAVGAGGLLTDLNVAVTLSQGAYRLAIAQP